MKTLGLDKTTRSYATVAAAQKAVIKFFGGEPTDDHTMMIISDGQRFSPAFKLRGDAVHNAMHIANNGWFVIAVN